MIEDFIIELEIPNKAIKILTYFLQELLYDDFDIEECKNTKIKNRYISSLIYTIKLVNNDIAKIKREYYKLMLKEKYNK